MPNEQERLNKLIEASKRRYSKLNRPSQHEHAFYEGATSEASKEYWSNESEKAVALAEAYISNMHDTIQTVTEILHEAKLQIEYLNEKFKETGSGNSLLSRIETTLDELQKK